MYKTIIIVVVLTMVFIIAFSGVEVVSNAIVNGNDNNTTSYVASQSTTTVQVTLTGEVTRTGTYTVQIGSTLGSVLDGAGGTTTNGDERCYNRNFVISVKNSFYIPPIYDNEDECSLDPISKICINTATQSQLEDLSAFSVTVAGAIITYRTSNGDFQQLEDLKNVPGIGSATFEKCKNYVTLYAV